MITRFVPTPNELFEYAISHGVEFVDYQSWVHNQLRDVLNFAFELSWNLIPLRPYSKAPTNKYPFVALTREEALQYFRDSPQPQLPFGIRGVGQDSKTLETILLDYDSKTLTPELEFLVTKKKALTIVSPNGFTFVVREPIVPELWAEMEKIDGFKPSQTMIDARVKRAIEYQNNHTKLVEAGFTQEELDVIVKPKDFTVSNARRNRSYACIAGSVTCSAQTKATGLAIPTNPETGKSVQHWGFGHTESDQPCNGNSTGKHDYRMRLFYQVTGDYTHFVPKSCSILPFEAFAKIALGMKN